MTSAVAMRVLLGTTSVSTAAPPEPVALDHGDLGAELGRRPAPPRNRRARRRGRRPARADARARHAPIVADAASGTARRTQFVRDRPARSVRCGPWPCTRRTAATSTRSGWRCAHPTRPCGHGLAGRLAADVRRRGRQLGGRARARSSRTPVTRSSSRCTTSPLRRGVARQVGGRRHRPLPQAPGAGADARRRRARPGSTCSTRTRAACRRARYLGMLADAAEAGGAPDDYVAELRSRPCALGATSHRRL